MWTIKLSSDPQCDLPENKVVILSNPEENEQLVISNNGKVKTLNLKDLSPNLLDKIVSHLESGSKTIDLSLLDGESLLGFHPWATDHREYDPTIDTTEFLKAMDEIISTDSSIFQSIVHEAIEEVSQYFDLADPKYNLATPEQLEERYFSYLNRSQEMIKVHRDLNQKMQNIAACYNIASQTEYIAKLDSILPLEHFFSAAQNQPQGLLAEWKQPNFSKEEKSNCINSLLKNEEQIREWNAQSHALSIIKSIDTTARHLNDIDTALQFQNTMQVRVLYKLNLHHEINKTNFLPALKVALSFDKHGQYQGKDSYLKKFFGQCEPTAYDSPHSGSCIKDLDLMALTGEDDNYIVTTF